MTEPHIEWNAEGLRKLAEEAAAKALEDPSGLKCVICGTELQRVDGKVVCPSCNLEYRLEG